MNPNSIFKVIVRDTTFKLSQSQIEFDSPNFFTACFLGDFQESQTRTLEISRDPDLFRIVLNYLCGYTILPLSEAAIPMTMTLGTALINLRVDAEYYQLNGLIQACTTAMMSIVVNRSSVSDKYRVLAGRTRIRPHVPGASNLSRFPDFHLLNSEKEPTDSSHLIRTFEDFTDTRVPEENIRGPLASLTTPDSCIGFDSIRELSAIESVIAKIMGQYDKTKWRLMGWNVRRSSNSELLIVLESI
ncbi:hypothetical protein BDV93DRAFT_546022 [Ceratobasidium sp. AG-I]|nr:hypothetical protein BDV93DRAFT_546022 [Ceratobasidium sp. AG-I]